MQRTKLCALLAAVVLAASVASRAIADDYPSKPIKVVVPTAPAGVGDMLARPVQQKLGWI
jgi:tripartite-type tricarboxylate transporter receptor subunit TctC